MKRFISLTIIICLILVILPAAAPKAVAATGEFRAVWVASVINLDYPSAPGLSAAALRKEADAILNNALDMGFTAVIFQVRPAGDALYKSNIFPWSEVLSGVQGVAPDEDFDPLEYFINGAHERGLELHAWVNPYRVARGAKDTSALCAANPAKKNPGWVVAHTDGNLYYNPGLPEVQKLVIDGVREIVENYDIDGIHYDDYFYPGKTFTDDAAFASYGKGYQDKANWRRDNVNTLIKATSEAVHKAKPSCRFGVSPQAIWANKSSTTLGSDTKGNETYYTGYADTRKWVLSEWVDYIAPQIYWEIGKEGSDYAKVLEWWVKLVRGVNVDLYIGHATYLLTDGKSNAWKDGSNEIIRQITLNRTYPEVSGSIHFRYSYIVKDTGIITALKTLNGDSVSAVSKDTGIVMPSPDIKFAVGRPSGNVTVTSGKYFFVGAGDPAVPVTVNGKTITSRSGKGYFCYYATLKNGKNTFEFKQGNKSITRVVTLSPGTSKGPDVMDKAELRDITPGVYDEIRSPGESITLKATAPIGASVSVRIGGVTLAMKPALTTKPNDGLIYATTFTVSYKMPSVNTDGRVVTIGTPVYTMRYAGKESTRVAASAIRCAGAGSPLACVVISDSAFTYPGATTSGGPNGELAKGQIGAVTAQQNGQWVRLSSGHWILRSDVAAFTRQSPQDISINSAEYVAGENCDILAFNMPEPAATSAEWNGKTLTFSLYNVNNAPVPVPPQGALMKSIDVSYNGTKVVYSLTPANGLPLDGYYVAVSETGIELRLKRRPQASGGEKPLEGISIVIDAGHGGDETGAYGAFGKEYAEKYVNLYAARKLGAMLTSLGAEVTLTRNSDTTTALKSRLDTSRTLRPDLFISLHCNSMNDDVNSESIRGVAVFYRENSSADFSGDIYNTLWKSLDLGHKGAHQSNLYVCRGFWTPSVIIEMGFINNPYDYEWLLDDSAQNDFLAVMAEGIVQYFR